MPVKKTRRRTTKSLGKKFVDNPVTTTVNTAKQLGVPKPVTKIAILGTAMGLIAPSIAKELDRIPFLNIATNAGRNLRARLMMGMRK